MAADRIVAPNLPTLRSPLLMPMRRRSSHRLLLPPEAVRITGVDATTVAKEVVADAVVAALARTVAVVAVEANAMAETAAQLPLTASMPLLTPRREAKVVTPREAVGTAEVVANAVVVVIVVIVVTVVTVAPPLPTKVATTPRVSTPAALVVEAAVAAVVDAVAAAALLQAIHTRLLIAPTEVEVASSRHVQRRVIRGSWNGMASICCRGS